MSHLYIQEIFSQFQSYQSHYLEIIQDPEQYYQPVVNAYIQFAALSEERIYLGDLLQLWLGDKWTEHQVEVLTDTKPGVWKQVAECWHSSLFLFALERKGLFTKTSALAWSTEEQQVRKITLEQVFPYYCHFLGLERPKR